MRIYGTESPIQTWTARRKREQSYGMMRALYRRETDNDGKAIKSDYYDLIKIRLMGVTTAGINRAPSGKD